MSHCRSHFLSRQRRYREQWKNGPLHLSYIKGVTNTNNREGEREFVCDNVLKIVPSRKADKTNNYLGFANPVTDYTSTGILLVTSVSLHSSPYYHRLESPFPLTPLTFTGLRRTGIPVFLKSKVTRISFSDIVRLFYSLY